MQIGATDKESNLAEAKENMMNPGGKPFTSTPVGGGGNTQLPNSSAGRKELNNGANLSTPYTASKAGPLYSPIRADPSMASASPGPPPSAGKLEVKEAAMALTWLSEAFIRHEEPVSPVQINHTAASNALLSADRTISTGSRSRRAASQRCVNTLREAIAAEREAYPSSFSRSSTYVSPDLARTARRVSRSVSAAVTTVSEKKSKGYSRNSRVGRAMEAILEYISEHQSHYQKTNGSGVPERVIRQEFGNNPDTSKALRFLVTEHRIVRSGAGGRRDPYSYMIAEEPEQKQKPTELEEADASNNTIQKQNDEEDGNVVRDDAVQQTAKGPEDVDNGLAATPAADNSKNEVSGRVLSPKNENGQTPLAPVTVLNNRPVQPRFSLTGVTFDGLSAIKAHAACRTAEDSAPTGPEKVKDARTTSLKEAKRLAYGSLVSPGGVYQPPAKRLSQGDSSTANFPTSMALTPLVASERPEMPSEISLSAPGATETPVTVNSGRRTEDTSCSRIYTVMQPMDETKRCVFSPPNALATPAGLLVPLPPHAMAFWNNPGNRLHAKDSSAVFAQLQHSHHGMTFGVQQHVDRSCQRVPPHQDNR